MYSAVKKYLKEALRGELPGAEAHGKMLPPGRRLKTTEQDLLTTKLSSVLLLLFPEGDQLYICLMKRTSTMKHHPGQISFPGGKVEKDDVSAEMAALREAREEVGIDPSSIEILGKLSDIYVEVSQFHIQPFIAWADQRPDFSLNSSEVEELILFPLNEFMYEAAFAETEIQTFSGPLRVKYFPFKEEYIWGATAMILSELFEILKRQKSTQ